MRHATTAFKRYEDRIKRDLPAMTQKERERWLGKQQMRRVQRGFPAQNAAFRRRRNHAVNVAARTSHGAAKDRLLAVLKSLGGASQSQGHATCRDTRLTLADIPVRVEAIEAQAHSLEDQLASGQKFRTVQDVFQAQRGSAAIEPGSVSITKPAWRN
jgi:hypothetical protein